MASRYHQEMREASLGASHITPLSIDSAVQVSSGVPGPNVTIFGAIHGDEPAGYHAILFLVRAFATQTYALTCGSLTLALGNEQALERGVRKVKYDLNRLFLDSQEVPVGYEKLRAHQLKEVLRNSDYFLDLHQTSAPSEPFLMCERFLEAEAARLGVERLVTGWGELSDTIIAGDTETYCLSSGGRGFTMENGHGTWAGGAECAIRVSLEFLKMAGVLQGPRTASDQVISPKVHRMFHSERCLRTSFCYARPVETFTSFKKGEEIGRDSEQVYYAPEDSVIIMPTREGRFTVGEELYFLATVEGKGATLP